MGKKIVMLDIICTFLSREVLMFSHIGKQEAPKEVYTNILSQPSATLMVGLAAGWDRATLICLSLTTQRCFRKASILEAPVTL